MRTCACSVLEPLHCRPCLCSPLTEPDDSPNSSWGLPKDPQPHSKPHMQLCCRLKKKFGAWFTDNVLLLLTFLPGSYQKDFWEVIAFLCRVIRLQNAAAIWKGCVFLVPPFLPFLISETWPVFSSHLLLPEHVPSLGLWTLISEGLYRENIMFRELFLSL